MKRFVTVNAIVRCFLVLFIIQPINAFGQIKPEKLEEIYEEPEPIQLLLTGDERNDSLLTKAVMDHWHLSSEIVILDAGSSIDRRNAYPPILEIQIEKLITTRSPLVRDLKPGVIPSYDPLESIKRIKISEASHNKMCLLIGNGKLCIGFDIGDDNIYLKYVEAIKRCQFFIQEMTSANNKFKKTWRVLINKYGSELNSLTLLVDTTLLSENIDADFISSVYPYKYDIVAKEEIETAIINNDSTKAFFTIIEEWVGYHIQTISNVATGKIYCANPGGFSMVKAENKKVNIIITRSDLKSLCGGVNKTDN